MANIDPPKEFPILDFLDASIILPAAHGLTADGPRIHLTLNDAEDKQVSVDYHITLIWKYFLVNLKVEVDGNVVFDETLIPESEVHQAAQNFYESTYHHLKTASQALDEMVQLETIRRAENTYKHIKEQVT